jgi:flagellar biosynthesis/type III secretory pathway protein FliH
MKLSPKMATELGPTPWLPAELPSSSPRVTEDGVKSMMDLFSAPGGQPAMKLGNRVLKGESGQLSSSPWLPGNALGLVTGRKGSEWVPATSWEEIETPSSTINAARRQAEKIIAEARVQAEQVLKETRDQADTIILNAHEEGWIAAQAETQELLSTAHAIVEQVNAWRSEMLENSQEEVLELVRVISKRIFGEGIELQTEMLQAAFTQALQDARALGDLKLYVHPQDAANLDPYWRDFQVAIGGHQIKIIPSEAIRRGGCFIDGEMGSVDARIETQLKSIMDVLGPEKEIDEDKAE